MAIQTKITFNSLREKRQIEKQAEKAGLSLSNYLRQALGLEPLTVGGQRPGAGRPKQESEQEQKPE
jgi:hypothetical protein